MAAGYIDGGSVGNATPGTFAVPDAKVKVTAKVDADTTAVIRLNYDNGVANGADFAYIKMDNFINKLANTNSPVNPEITVGKFKTPFGEETQSNNPVEGALVSNSQANPTGNDAGILFKQDDLVKNLPMMLCASFALLNGNGAADNNNTKAHMEKVSATFKDMPLYISLSNYGTGHNGTAVAPALSIDGNRAVGAGTWYSKVVELDVRYDMTEGKAFDPTKAPLFSDAKGVFRLAIGQGVTGQATTAARTEYNYVALDGIYNVDGKWYAAFRYSYVDYDGDKFTRISIGGGHKMSENTILKAEYTQNSEPDTTTIPEVDNNQVSILWTTKW